MTCHEDQGTANPNARWPFEDAGNNAATIGYLQVVPEEFTREELQALRNKAKSQLDWNAEGIRADLLEDLVETLDLLDALEARDEADLAELEEKIAEHSQPAGVTITNAPFVVACPHCPTILINGVPIGEDGWPA